jgi:hypothetical protein
VVLLLRPNLDRHAGIFGPFPLVRISFDGSAHVRMAGFVVQLYRPKSDIVSYAIWEFNKIVVALASASWVANSVSYIVGGSIFFFHSLQTASSETCFRCSHIPWVSDWKPLCN